MFKEKNIIIKNPLKEDIRFGLVYPNVYKTAMSSLGYQIIYNYVNEKEDTYSERIIYPSTRSLETNSPLSDFDIVSFSLQYEQDYFHVLEMLREAGIPLRREDRASDDPLIIAGGPCASANPLPLSDFIDIFVVGEAEAVLYDFLDLYSSLKLSKRSKKNKINNNWDSFDNEKMDLSPFLDIEGLYISEFNNETNIVLSDDMESIYHLTCPIVTETDDKDFIPAFSNSILLNVSRACTRGCRFCMSSYMYRPLRETNLDDLFSIAEEARANTGLNKISLIGAAVSDYSQINELTEGLNERGFQVSTPSMRIESITMETLAALKSSGLKTLTIAPESIYSLRRRINKDIRDEEILRVISDAVELGFNIKLYFLIGLPYESEDDIGELANMMKQIDSMKYNIDSNPTSSIKLNDNSIKSTLNSSSGNDSVSSASKSKKSRKKDKKSKSNKKAKVSISFSVNPVIPKPHTPLQWERYDMKEIKSKIRYLKKNLKGLDIKFDSAKMGLIQYVLSCGDKDIGNLIERSLNEKISIREWGEKAPSYDLEDDLPWDSINVSVSKEFLKSEYEKIKTGEQTPWCEDGICYDCGACN
ncbi:MAG: B12-binding domain-containing radical SAM protein [Methanobrevibacter ruminantium]|uniref:radical SAM protein n=1 Tax=Methanobrevibacter ruminantium TaxID=83816 RepID=UPI002D8009DD|nr:radical SAM protein [Methanobrevibacter ruminantium]MCI5737831.1 B12-binding domain-containing radical SAM protein [Methanobrevibacter ruminantium]